MGPTSGIKAWFWPSHGFKSLRCLLNLRKHLVCASRGRLLGDAMCSPTHRWLIMWCSMFTNSHGFWCNGKWALQRGVVFCMIKIVRFECL